MKRLGFAAGLALSALIALPASAQLGGAVGGAGQIAVPGVSAGGSGSATIDATGVTSTARDTARQGRATASAAAEAAKRKAAEAKAKAESATPTVSVGAGASASGGASVDRNGASASAGASAKGSAEVQH